MQKISNSLPNVTEKSYKNFISEKVLRDRNIIDFITKNNLSKEQIEENIEIFYQFYITKDSNLEINHIPKLFYKDNSVHIVYDETEDYKKYKSQITLENKIKTEFIPSKILTYTFSNVIRIGDKIKLAVDCAKICDNIKNGSSTKGAYIYGPTGVGKTYLLGCVYNYFKDNGIEPTILYFPDFVRKIKSKISTNDYEMYVDLIREEPILIIDDIGAENITEFIRDEILAPIINYREAENLPTFFSSNLALDDLMNVLAKTRNSFDQTKALRIVERIKSLTIPYLLDIESERK